MTRSLGASGRAIPLSEETADVSPYAFVNNNPIAFLDPMGLDTSGYGFNWNDFYNSLGQNGSWNNGVWTSDNYLPDVKVSTPWRSMTDTKPHPQSSRGQGTLDLIGFINSHAVPAADATRVAQKPYITPKRIQVKPNFLARNYSSMSKINTAASTVSKTLYIIGSNIGKIDKFGGPLTLVIGTALDANAMANGTINPAHFGGNLAANLLLGPFALLYDFQDAMGDYDGLYDGSGKQTINPNPDPETQMTDDMIQNEQRFENGQ